MVGKWHLGQLPQFLPKQQGFDSWFGLPYSHDMRMTVPRDKGFKTAAYYDPKPEYWDVPLMRDDQVIERPVDHRTLTKRYTEEAVRFIAENKNGPFFLYLAHSLPHIPLARSDEFVGHSAGGMYGDVIEEIDWSVGKCSMRCEPQASIATRWCCSRATTGRGCHFASTAARPVR